MFDLIEDLHGYIYLPDKSSYEYYGKGQIGFLRDVLLVPELDGMYISCSKFDEEGKEIVIKDGRMTVYDENGMVVCEANREGGLYVFNKNFEEENEIEELNQLNIKQGSAPARYLKGKGSMKEIDYLHHRWGHINERAIKEGLKRESITGALVDPTVVLKQELSFCPDCIKGKMKEVAKRRSSTVYDKSKPMYVLHSDSKGPFSIMSWPDHYRYFELYLFVPSYYIIIKFKKNKDEFYENFEEVMKESLKVGHEVKYFQTDDENVYSSQQCTESLDKYNFFDALSPPIEWGGRKIYSKSYGDCKNHYVNL